MLSSASKGKDLAEKQLIVLGGTSEQQRTFLEQLNPENLRSRTGNDRRRTKMAPISNRYTLGYTYHDVLDADQEDILARLNIHLLSNPSASFAPLLRPLLTAKTVKNTLIAILLDWSDPFRWARQLRQWVRLLRSVILSLDEETKIEMEENMAAWKEKRVGPDAPSTQPGGNIGEGASMTEQKQLSTVPLGPGEWDEGLGIPVSVVCVQAEKIETLERDMGWQEEQFDYLMQWLRSVLLKHGASLIYTASFDSNNVRTLIHSSLSIHSLLKREVSKHNVVDRDKILIPPNWDSWGKIRILKEGFDPELIGDAWSVEIQAKPEERLDLTKPASSSESEADSAVSMFETSLPDLLQHRRQSQNPQSESEAVTVQSVQEFLQAQSGILEGLKADDEKNNRRSRKDGSGTPTGVEDDGRSGANARMAEHIGPYQINVNGIDFDAEEATRRLRERENERNAVKTEGRTSSGTSTPIPRKPAASEVNEGISGSKPSNEAMSAFFANLIKKDKRSAMTTSNSASPTRGVAGDKKGES